MTDRLDPTRLAAAPLVATVESHEVLGSTNDRAKQLATETTRLPALVVAETQTAGRGRGGARWWSGASGGALTFSLLIDPAAHGVAGERAGLLSLAAALAVIDATNAAGVDAGLKWPNDVLVGRKKLAGVLLESPRPDRLVIGVGVNANNRFDDAPDEVRQRATSLATEARRTVDRNELLAEFLRSLAVGLEQVAAGGAETVRAARKACVLSGQEVAIESAGRTIAGPCLGIADDGALLVETAEGPTSVVSGSVTRFGQPA